MSSEMENELRQLLHRKSAAVSPPPRVPEAMLKRARHRIVRNVAAAAIVAVALAVGTYSGVQALSGPSRLTPIGPTPTPTTSATGMPLTRACAADDVRGAEALNGAAGSLQGSLVLRVSWKTTCQLQGRPVVRLVSPDGSVANVPEVPTMAWWQVDTAAKPPGWPVVTLSPGHAAVVRVGWSNYCGTASSLEWHVTLPTGADVRFPAHGAPPCNGPGQPGRLEVGPFEPASHDASPSP